MSSCQTFVAAVSTLLASGAFAQAAAPPLTADSVESGLPIVITPTRLRQSLADVPASVTIITAQMLQQYGIRSVPEALRLVPGMAVIHATGADYQISYHGTNTLSPRRMNVLIDGISAYRPAFSEVIWTQLPVAIEDIERIEVTRGPNSASYGPNSMLAVVNIITKQPADVDKAQVMVLGGTQSQAELSARVAFTLGSSSVSIALNRVQDGGYDHVAQDLAGHDSMRVNRLNARAVTQFGQSSTLDLQAMVAQGTIGIPFADDFQLSYPDRHYADGYLGATWTERFSENHELQVRLNHTRQHVEQGWRTCLPTGVLLPEMFELWRANPAYAVTVLRGRVPTGGSRTDDALALAALLAIRQLGAGALAPSCGRTNQDSLQQRTDFELQDTYVLSPDLRIVAGVGARQQRGESQTFLGGAQTSQLQWLFGNVEGRPARWVTVNAGGYLERSTLSASTFSPRAALNFHVSPGQTLRMVVSRGTRSPDIFEQRANWTYSFEDLAPPLRGSTTARLYQSRQGPGNLQSERVESREVGYLLNVPRYGLLLDARVFDDKLYSLISERTNLAGLVPTNAGSVRLRGLEVQTSTQWAPRWSGYVHYAYLENRDATNLLERTQYSRHSGSLGVNHEFAAGWQASVAYSGAAGDGYQQSSYGRTDVTVSKTDDWDGAQWRAVLGLRRLDNPVTMYSVGAPDPLSSRYDSRLQGFAQLAVRWP